MNRRPELSDFGGSLIGLSHRRSAGRVMLSRPRRHDMDDPPVALRSGAEGRGRSRFRSIGVQRAEPRVLSAATRAFGGAPTLSAEGGRTVHEPEVPEQARRSSRSHEGERGSRYGIRAADPAITTVQGCGRRSPGARTAPLPHSPWRLPRRVPTSAGRSAPSHVRRVCAQVGDRQGEDELHVRVDVDLDDAVANGVA
jgi:hypothetical protein